MKKKYYVITAVASYLVLLIATIPASAISNVINNTSTVSIQGASGTLWHGKAYVTTINKSVQLKNTEWSVSLWKLLTGKIAVNMDTHFADKNINAEFGRSFLGRYFINDLKAKITAGNIAKLANIPLAQLSGLVSINIAQAQWTKGELPTATGKILWSDAIVTVAESASLGNIIIVLKNSEQNLLNANISNQGGDIEINGIVELKPKANYAVDIKLTPTATANNNIKQNLGLFAKKQNNGDYHLQHSGALSQIGF